MYILGNKYVFINYKIYLVYISCAGLLIVTSCSFTSSPQLLFWPYLTSQRVTSPHVWKATCCFWILSAGTLSHLQCTPSVLLIFLLTTFNIMHLSVGCLFICKRPKHHSLWATGKLESLWKRVAVPSLKVRKLQSKIFSLIIFSLQLSLRYLLSMGHATHCIYTAQAFQISSCYHIGCYWRAK